MTDEGRIIRLQPQPTRVLLLLLSKAGALVTREELRSALWSDGTNVEFDQGLNYCISQIRAALKDSRAEPHWIETVPKRGYRFVGNVVPVLDPPAGEADLATPRVEPAVAPTPPPKPDSAPSGKHRTWFAAAALLALAAGGLYLAARDRSPAEGPKTVLVRTFLPTGLPPEEEWYGDSLAQQVISALAQGGKPKVLPYSTSLALKGKLESVREIGKRYGADAIIEGSVRRSGSRIHVSAQMVEAATERVLWSHDDEREAGEMGRIEASMISSIARSLRFRLEGAETPAARQAPQDRETYSLYLRANVLSDQYGPDTESEASFREVIRRAPGFAPAHARLASLLARGAQGDLRGPALTEAKRVADQALQLDPGSAEAHTALAHVYMKAWKWADAEAEYRTALSLDPNLAEARQLYGLFLAMQGRFAEAFEQSNRAVELAPTSALLWFSWSQVRLHANRFDEAIEGAKRALELDRAYTAAVRNIARAHALKGEPAKALELLGNSQRHSNNYNPEVWRACHLAQLGRKREALETLAQWERNRPAGAPQPLVKAIALFQAGEADRAFESLRVSVANHVSSAMWLKVTPELEPYRNDERYRKLVALLDGR